MIESPEGINNLDAMLAEGGIDGVFVGPNDLLGNMGETPSMWSEAKVFQEGMQHILQTCKKHKVAAGIHCADHQAVSDRIAEGYQFLALASEAASCSTKRPSRPNPSKAGRRARSRK